MPSRSPYPMPYSAMPPITAIIVFAHGSKVPEANEVFVRLAAEVNRQSGSPARAAFLEIAPPDLGAAITAAVREGARRVVIAPAFLTIGRHVSEDLPRLVSEQQAAHPGIEILAGQSLEGHPGVAAILLDRVHDVLAHADAVNHTDALAHDGAPAHAERGIGEAAPSANSGVTSGE